MDLSQEQKEEIKAYIIDVPRYKETYNELYDHILNSLKDNAGSYHINEVIDVINNDFGGFQAIVGQEKIYQKQLNKRYNNFFLQEMLNTFKWPGIINVLCLLFLALVIFNGSRDAPDNTDILLKSCLIIVISMGLFGFSRVLFFRLKNLKYSILDNYFFFVSSFGISIVAIVLTLFVRKENLLDLSDSGKLIIVLLLYGFTSIYVRSFIRFFNREIKVLAI